MIKTPESQYLPGITAFQNNRKKVCKFLLTYGVYFVIINESSREIRQRREMRKCRNWQTSKTKDLVMLTSCGFKSHLPHASRELRKLEKSSVLSFLFWKKEQYCGVP